MVKWDLEESEMDIVPSGHKKKIHTSELNIQINNTDLQMIQT